MLLVVLRGNIRRCLLEDRFSACGGISGSPARRHIRGRTAPRALYTRRAESGALGRPGLADLGVHRLSSTRIMIIRRRRRGKVRKNIVLLFVFLFRLRSESTHDCSCACASTPYDYCTHVRNIRSHNNTYSTRDRGAQAVGQRASVVVYFSMRATCLRTSSVDGRRRRGGGATTMTAVTAKAVAAAPSDTVRWTVVVVVVVVR